MTTSPQTGKAENPAEKTNLSHAERNTLAGVKESIARKIKEKGDLPYVTSKRLLELLDELSQFELGKFLLQTGGLNGYWTNYVIQHPQEGRLTGLNLDNQPFSSLESFILDQAPTCLATQERFSLFKREIQSRLHDGVALASIPCGLTADLLDLDFSNLSDFSLFGIDIDPDSLQQSQQRAEKLGLASHCQFLQKNAWNLGCMEQFDVITSNGLSIYEENDTRVEDLYHQFFLALKPKGCLITSFLTPPPIPGTLTEWDLSALNTDHALLQKIIFTDIIDTKWQKFRSEETVRAQLIKAGFTEIEVFYDKAHIFPTVVAKKS